MNQRTGHRRRARQLLVKYTSCCYRARALCSSSTAAEFERAKQCLSLLRKQINAYVAEFEILKPLLILGFRVIGSPSALHVSLRRSNFAQAVCSFTTSLFAAVRRVKLFVVSSEWFVMVVRVN